MFPLKRVPFVWNKMEFVSSLIHKLSKAGIEYAVIDGFIYVSKTFDVTPLLQMEKKFHYERAYKQFLFYAPPTGAIMNTLCEFMSSTGVEFYIESGRLFVPRNYDTEILFSMCVLNSKMSKEQ